MSDVLTAEDVIRQHDLKRETFRDATRPHGRAHSTAILLLMKAGEVPRWHKVDAAELWQYGGATPARSAARHRYRLGPDWHKGDTRMPRCRRMPGRARGASGRGQCSAAPLRPASISGASNSRPTISSRDGIVIPAQTGIQ